MVTGLPDWWIGRRLPEPTLGPLHVKLAATATGTIPGTTTGTANFGTPPAEEVWQIHHVKVSIDHSSLIRVFLYWEGMIIQGVYGYGKVEISIPKGLDYRSGNYLIVEVYNYNPESVTVRIDVNGIVVKL